MNARVRSPGLERRGDRLGRWRRRLPVGVLQAAQRHVERLLLAVQLDAQRGDELAEQPAHALWLEIDFSARIFSSGSESRCGR